jgi:hypothetical protein
MFDLTSIPLVSGAMATFRSKSVSDSADRLSYSVSAVMMLIFALTISAKQ